jgi:uncharacterized protein (UPF0332 family)
MTTRDERYQEFMDECVNATDVRPGATRIDGAPARQREAERCRNQADYHALAARDNLEGRAPLMAIREGYYVMLHKANEALALAGFKPRTHVCTLLGLRGVFNAADLADMLRRASNERQNVDYFIDPEHPELAEFAGPREFVEGPVEEFVRRVDSLLEEEGLLGEESG